MVFSKLVVIDKSRFSVKGYGFLGKFIETEKMALRRKNKWRKKTLTASHQKQQPSLMRLVERVYSN